jgi:type III secretion protein D
MKQVRILTGVHAGAQLVLDTPSIRLGNGADFDIAIDDWNHAPIELVIEEGESVSAYVLSGVGEGGAKQFAGRLEDFVPRRFLDIVLCCGPAEGVWPADVSLLENLMRPAPIVVAPPAKKPWRLWTALGLSSVSLLAVFGTVVARHSAAAQRQPQESLVSQVTRVVHALPFQGLVVTMEGERVVVEGMLESPGQVNTTRAALSRFPKTRLAHRYAAADQTARAIAEALGGKGLSAAYSGNGVFVVQGQSQQLDRLQDAVQRLTSDLGPLVKRIDIDVAALPPPDKVPVGSVLATPGLQVVETRDGAKYMTLSPLPVVELVDLPNEK